ncbi:ribosomal RNA processing protein 36 homolog isoform X2 [Rhynchophorus ferrugineus]|uniref:ribosomal RNA processing protein 36 homolog isoform X2 n=1 Tax=Rhynchophorus ferrugineus TaxID=354439 RepID=UPI003FCDFABB
MSEEVSGSDISENEQNQDEETQEDEVERKQIRQNLTTLSFEELIKLKEKLGAKVYNETVYGDKTKKAKNPPNLKRANKNRPREISSKLKPKQIGRILGNTGPKPPVTKKSAPRDPRFDTLCGQFDKKTFTQNYKFVNNLRRKEKEQLEKEYQECTDPERKKIIKLLKQRIENQLREEENRAKQKQKEENQKNEIKNKIKQGEKPVYKKRSVKRLEGLVEKYEDLKKTNKLQKHLEKRTKKLKTKDRKMMLRNNIDN